jgi:hypothetical protein
MTEPRRWTTGHPRWQCSICGERFPDATRLSQHVCPQRHATPDEATEQEIQDLAHKTKLAKITWVIIVLGEAVPLQH